MLAKKLAASMRRSLKSSPNLKPEIEKCAPTRLRTRQPAANTLAPCRLPISGAQMAPSTRWVARCLLICRRLMATPRQLSKKCERFVLRRWLLRNLPARTVPLRRRRCRLCCKLSLSFPWSDLLWPVSKPEIPIRILPLSGQSQPLGWMGFYLYQCNLAIC